MNYLSMGVYSPPLHQLFEEKRTMFEDLSSKQKTKSSLGINSLLVPGNSYPRDPLPLRPVPANHYYLAYALARVWWKSLIQSFHSLKYNKSYGSLKERLERGEGKVKEGRKNVGVGLELLSSFMRKMRLKTNQRALADGFHLIAHRYKCVRISEEIRGGRIRWGLGQLRKCFRKQSNRKRGKKGGTVMAKQSPGRRHEREEKVLGRGGVEKGEKDPKRGGDGHFQNLDSKLDELQTLISNTRKMREQDNERKERIQRMLREQRMNRYSSQTKSKSHFKSTPQSLQKSKFKLTPSLKADSKQTKPSYQNYYTNHKPSPSKYPQPQYYSQPQPLHSPPIQPIIYQIIQPIYITPQSSPISTSTPSSNLNPPSTPGFYHYLVSNDKQMAKTPNGPASQRPTRK